MKKYFFCCVLAAVLVCLISRRAFAGAIDVPMQSAKAAGEADAFTAQADDPSAIFYNPSGLTQLTGTQFSVGAFYLQPIFEFHGTDGSGERMTLPSVLPHFYLESDLGTKNLRVGLGAVNEFGINEDYGNAGPLATLVNKAQLSVINLSPTIAYRINDHLSLGVAANIYYGQLSLERNVLLAAPPAPPGDFKLNGRNFGFGATPSLMYKFNENNQVGVYYRSPSSINFTGHAQIESTIIPEIGPSDASESLNLPQSIGIGYAFRPNQLLTLEADIIWTDWHAVKQLLIQSPNPAFNNQSLPASWDSGFTFRTGAQYMLSDHWALRGGYAYGQNSVPESTFSPLVPDSNYNLGAIGIGYNSQRWSLDFAYEFIYREGRHISNSVNSPTVDGTWNNQIHGVMLTYGMKL